MSSRIQLLGPLFGQQRRYFGVERQLLTQLATGDGGDPYRIRMATVVSR